MSEMHSQVCRPLVRYLAVALTRGVPVDASGPFRTYSRSQPLILSKNITDSVKE